MTAQVQVLLSYPPQLRPFLADLIAYWDALTFTGDDENAYIVDTSGNGHDMWTSVGEELVVSAGVNGNSVLIPSYFNNLGSNTPLNVRSLDVAFKFGNVPFSFGRWVKMQNNFQNDNTARLLLGRWHTGPGGTLNDRSYILFYDRINNLFGAALCSDGTGATSHQITKAAGTATDWHFIVCGYDGSTIHFWVDAGTPVTVAHTGGAYAGSDADFSFDYRHGTVNVPFGDNDVSAKVTVNAFLMSAFVLGRMITQAEVDNLYNSGTRVLYSELDF